MVRDYMGLLKYEFLLAVKFNANPAMRMVMVTFPICSKVMSSYTLYITHTHLEYTCVSHTTFCNKERTTYSLEDWFGCRVCISASGPGRPCSQAWLLAVSKLTEFRNLGLCHPLQAAAYLTLSSRWRCTPHRRTCLCWLSGSQRVTTVRSGSGSTR